jgi:hypothetical protein
MLLRLRERGDSSLIYGLRGRPSNRKLAARLEQKILARVRQCHADFGPTLAAEHLAKEGFLVSRETLRKWMTKAALWRPRSQRVKETISKTGSRDQWWHRLGSHSRHLSTPSDGPLSWVDTLPKHAHTQVKCLPKKPENGSNCCRAH